MSDKEQIEELIQSLHICSQSSSCVNCMFKLMKDEYEQEFGKPEFTCRSALMDAAAELLGYLIPGPGARGTPGKRSDGRRPQGRAERVSPGAERPGGCPEAAKGPVKQDLTTKVV